MPQRAVRERMGHSSSGKKPVRKRKRKDEISRDFLCVAKGCNKSYGSENSRNLHLKIKHLSVWEKVASGEIDCFDKKKLIEENGRLGEIVIKREEE